MAWLKAPRCHVFRWTLAGLLAGGLGVPAQAQPAAPKAEKDVRYVVFHRPGPAWLPGKGLFEQPVMAAHIQHYRQWQQSGKLEFGGPHLDAGGGGMMIPAAGVSEEEVRRHAQEDPAVKHGTLTAEVRPWLVGMSK